MATGPRPFGPALMVLSAGDVLLVAGKGHEGQTIGPKVIHFSDHEAVRAAIRGGLSWLNLRSGQRMNWLPVAENWWHGQQAAEWCFH